MKATIQGWPTREMLPAAGTGMAPPGGDLSLEPGQQASLVADHTLQGQGLATGTGLPICFPCREERLPSQTMEGCFDIVSMFCI